MFDTSAPSEGNENIATSTLSFTDDAGHPPTRGRNFDVHVRPDAKAFPHVVTIGWNLSEPECVETTTNLSVGGEASRELGQALRQRLWRSSRKCTALQQHQKVRLQLRGRDRHRCR